MKKQNRWKTIVSDLIFYVILISMVVAVVAVTGGNGKGPRVFGGYSAFVVLTGSMEEVIPKGSLVITKSVDPSELQVGDDITFMVSETTTVTHRIVEIQEKYLNTGERAFKTQGVMNAEPDVNPVAAVNVVGKVIWHNKPLGTVISYGQENWPLLIFFLAVFLTFIKLAEIILRHEEIENLKKNEKIIETSASDKEVEIIDL